MKTFAALLITACCITSTLAAAISSSSDIAATVTKRDCEIRMKWDYINVENGLDRYHWTFGGPTTKAKDGTEIDMQAMFFSPTPPTNFQMSVEEGWVHGSYVRGPSGHDFASGHACNFMKSWKRLSGCSIKEKPDAGACS